MRIALFTLILAFGLPTSGETGPKPNDSVDVEKELEKFQGVWTLESVEVDGVKLSTDQFKGRLITFEGERYSVKEGNKLVEGGTQELDPSKSPKIVDVTVTDGPNKGTVMLGIYEISGDTLNVCFDPEGKQRPTEFAGATGSRTLVVYKRAKSLAKMMQPIYLKEVEAYSLAVATEPEKELELRKEPVFGWSNPVGEGIPQGAIFLWLRDGRPAALGGVFSHPLPGWEGRKILHELLALDRDKLLKVRKSGRPCSTGIPTPGRMTGSIFIAFTRRRS